MEQNRGSCASLVWSMLQEENYPVNEDVRMGTALYYGLYMDTNQFSELFNPLDMDMREEVAVDKRLIMSRIRLEAGNVAGTILAVHHQKQTGERLLSVCRNILNWYLQFPNQ